MSKMKKKIDKSNIRENEIVSRDDKMDARVYLWVGVAALVIIVGIILWSTIQWGGDKAAIRKEYSNLPEDHVFEYITMDQVKDKINKGESFHLFIGSGRMKDANDFVKYVDEYAKKKEYNIETVYYLKSTEISKADRNYFREMLSSFPTNLTAPSITYFAKTISDTSTVVSSSLDRNIAHFNNNLYNLIGDYFIDVDQNIEN